MADSIISRLEASRSAQEAHQQQELENSENTFTGTLYEAVFSVVYSYLKSKQIHDVKASAGRFVIEQAHQAALRITEQAEQPIKAAVTNVGRPSQN